MTPADRRASFAAHISIRGKTNVSAVLFWREFVKAGGVQLNPKLWRVDLGARKVLTDSIEEAIIHGRSSTRQCEYFFASDSHLLGASRDSWISDVVTDIEPDSDEDESIEDHVDGLFHHYINLAHGSAYMAGGELTPGFGGWRYLLSPADYFPGISRLYAEQNLFGLGGGVYPDRIRCPWPKFRDLAFVVMVFKDQIPADAMQSKETSIHALARLSPDNRADILGEEKARYFDEGLLRSWMIGSRDRAVRDRLVRSRSLQNQ